MAKLITKFKYLKPSDKRSPGGYAKYIATREGVEKIDDSQRFAPETKRQRQFIQKIISDFPESTSILEYEDYLNKPTRENASEFISRAIEDHADEIMTSKTYADYIATRPRAERIGSHGLFTEEGVQVNLAKVSRELNLHNGNVWTAIISLRREDAERLGYNTGERWRQMLRAQSQELSDQLHIPMQDLKWFAAFHNEGHHPHVHLMVYSTNRSEGFLSKSGIDKLRSSIAREIFHQDLISVYEKQTEHRNALRTQRRDMISEIVSRINSGTYDNPALENKLLDLADRLSKTSGKKQYGYLKADVKAIVNGIVSDLAADERIASLYDLWYEQREEVIRTYTEELPERIPLVDNSEFKSIKNVVIQEALNISADRLIADEQDEQAEVKAETSEPEADEVEEQEYAPAPRSVQRSRMWQLYRNAKELLDRESDAYDPNTAVNLLIEAAGLGCGVAKYRLGKMFLRGEDVPKSIDYALRWLEESVSEGNPYTVAENGNRKVQYANKAELMDGIVKKYHPEALLESDAAGEGGEMAEPKQTDAKNHQPPKSNRSRSRQPKPRPEQADKDGKKGGSQLSQKQMTADSEQESVPQEVSDGQT